MVKSIIDVETQVKVYKKYKNEIFDANCKAKPCSNDIYRILTSELKGMTAKGIQTSINRNVKKILDDQEVKEEINKENIHYFPSEFLDVIMQVEDNVDETNKSHSEDNGVVLTKEFVDDVHRETLGSENESTEDVEDIDTDDSFATEGHTFDSFYKLYHKEKTDDVIAQLPASYETVSKQLEIVKQVIDTLNKSHQELLSKHGRCSEQVKECEKSRLNHVKLSNAEIKNSLTKVQNLQLEVRTLTESKQQISGVFDALKNELKASERHRSELLDREKLAGEEIKNSLTKVQNLQLEVRTLTESKQQISGVFDALKNELKASERHRSELLDREKLAGEEIKNSLTKVQNLQLEVRTLTESKQQISGVFDALKNELKASERHRSELLDREKLAGEEIKNSLTKVQNLQLEVRTLTESKCRSTDKRKSQFNERSRKRKLTSKYYGPEWSH